MRPSLRPTWASTCRTKSSSASTPQPRPGRRKNKRPLSAPSSSATSIPAVLDRLCYRYPSALVDAVTEHDPGRRVVAFKNVTVNEEFFQGHFPGAPLMPGVLMIETLAQVATILLTQGSGEQRFDPSHGRCATRV